MECSRTPGVGGEKSGRDSSFSGAYGRLKNEARCLELAALNFRLTETFG